MIRMANKQFSSCENCLTFSIVILDNLLELGTLLAIIEPSAATLLFRRSGMNFGLSFDVKGFKIIANIDSVSASQLHNQMRSWMWFKIISTFQIDSFFPWCRSYIMFKLKLITFAENMQGKWNVSIYLISLDNL